MHTYVINHTNYHFHKTILSAMFQQRKELFVDRLGWANMVVNDGGESDEADTDPHVTYLVTVSDTNLLVGSCRLTPSVGKCLLGDPLSNYLDAQIERLETTWELTRFAPATDPSDPNHGHSFALLATGVLEWALGSGVNKVFGIAEPPLMAIAGGLGWRIAIEGPPVEYEPGKSAFAFSFPVDEATLQSTRSAFRLRGRVLSDPFEKDEVAA